LFQIGPAYSLCLADANRRQITSTDLTPDSLEIDAEIFRNLSQRQEAFGWVKRNLTHRFSSLTA